MLAVKNIGKTIFDSPKSSLPVFHKSVNLISHDPVNLMCVCLNMGAGNILKYLNQLDCYHP